MSSKLNREIEIKLRVADARAPRLRLERLGAKEIIPRTFESNTLYDTTWRDLTRRGELIRIRIERPASRSRRKRPAGTSNAVVTYKGPSGTKPGGGRFKIKDEVEVTVDRGGRMSRILKVLGLGPVFRYEKYRTTYALRGVPGLKVEFDETLIGHFLELEGDPSLIDRAARLLGYSRSGYLVETYGALYLAERRRSGKTPTNMLFRASKKLR